MAMVIFGGNVAGIYGAQLFRSDDSPRYRRAFDTGCAILAFAIVLAAGMLWDDMRNKVRAKTGEAASRGSYSGDEKNAASLSGNLPASLVADGKSSSVPKFYKAGYRSFLEALSTWWVSDRHEVAT
ncbi:hypothetical protein B0A48_08572 [Cryoendolithus antarcticus]|uniref:Uncharacterized protein n=1 Tax=Cryoendolithus antarcticus TaxID=1507870 RepID=A0A1V8T664_9PEZI|nr:hypothetical protein B0A48_08572 [Cryoendolithus antarcticus]